MRLERSTSHLCKKRDQRCELATTLILAISKQSAGPRSLTFLPTVLLCVFFFGLLAIFLNLDFLLFNLVILDKLAIQALLTLFQKMAPANLTCRIRVEKAESDDGDNGQSQEVATFPLRDCPDIGIEIRTRWTTESMKYFEQTGEPHTGIRPWDFFARLDGSIESLTMLLLNRDAATR